VQNPQNIQFSQPGNWTVTLIAQNGMGADTIVMPD
jgi:PKD repeat protein